MARQKTPEEFEAFRIAKITRSLIRLKHSLDADEEINRVLPERLSEYTKALQSGELITLSLDEAASDVQNS